MTRRLGRSPLARKGLPRLLFFTDPARTPDPRPAIARLPKGAGVVFRAFAMTHRVELGRALARIARVRRLTFFVGADAGLAVAIRADGVHLPEASAGRRGRVQALRRRFIVTAAAHSWPAVLRAQRSGVDAVIVSPVFTSRSPSAGRPLGRLTFSRMARAARLPLYALGGVNSETMCHLMRTGATGVAAIDALAD